jgi:hypothetical protein
MGIKKVSFVENKKDNISENTYSSYQSPETSKERAKIEKSEKND